MTRKVWVTAHRWVGLALLLFVALTGLTGALITFDLDRLLASGLRVIEPGEARLSLDGLIAHAQRSLPQYRIDSIEVAQAADESYQLGITPRGGLLHGEYHQAYIDPYRGKLLGTRIDGQLNWTSASIVPFLYKLHYSLALGDAGMWCVGLVALLWIISTFVGFYLAVPKGKSLLQMVRIKRGASRYRLAYDLHKASGVASGIVLLVVAFSGLTMNWEKETNALIEHVSSRTPMPRPVAAAIYSNQRHIGFTAAAGIAHNLRPDHRLVGIAFDAERSTYRVRLAEPDALRLRGQYFLYLDGFSGALLADYNLRRGSAGDVFIGWQLPLHSGQAFGLPGRIAIFISGLIAVLIPLTGWIIWRKKSAAKRHVNARVTG